MTRGDRGAPDDSKQRATGVAMPPQAIQAGYRFQSHLPDCQESVPAQLFPLGSRHDRRQVKFWSSFDSGFTYQPNPLGLVLSA